VLAALGCVDWVTVFDEPDPLALIRLLKPDVLVKGADWQEWEIIGAEEVRAAGGEVVRIDLVPGLSTTGLMAKITARSPETGKGGQVEEPPDSVPRSDEGC
jgi:D-beta-D-heptose 7-phosphate kinase/D-beta-D-heptose 1-phosphate adenosyltransferase